MSDGITPSRPAIAYDTNSEYQARVINDRADMAVGFARQMTLSLSAAANPYATLTQIGLKSFGRSDTLYLTDVPKGASFVLRDISDPLVDAHSFSLAIIVGGLERTVATIEAEATGLQPNAWGVSSQIGGGMINRQDNPLDNSVSFNFTQLQPAPQDAVPYSVATVPAPFLLMPLTTLPPSESRLADQERLEAIQDLETGKWTLQAYNSGTEEIGWSVPIAAEPGVDDSFIAEGPASTNIADRTVPSLVSGYRYRLTRTMIHEEMETNEQNAVVALSPGADKRIVTASIAPIIERVSEAAVKNISAEFNVNVMPTGLQQAFVSVTGTARTFGAETDFQVDQGSTQVDYLGLMVPGITKPVMILRMNSDGNAESGRTPHVYLCGIRVNLSDIISLDYTNQCFTLRPNAVLNYRDESGKTVYSHTVSAGELFRLDTQPDPPNHPLSIGTVAEGGSPLWRPVPLHTSELDYEVESEMEADEQERADMNLIHFEPGSEHEPLVSYAYGNLDPLNSVAKPAGAVYTKLIEVRGIPVVATDDYSDETLRYLAQAVERFLASVPENYVEAMVRRHKVITFAPDPSLPSEALGAYFYAQIHSYYNDPEPLPRRLVIIALHEVMHAINDQLESDFRADLATMHRHASLLQFHRWGKWSSYGNANEFASFTLEEYLVDRNAFSMRYPEVFDFFENMFASGRLRLPAWFYSPEKSGDDESIGGGEPALPDDSSAPSSDDSVQAEA